MARDGIEGESFQIQRWTKNPSVYLRTINDSGRLLDPQALDIAQSTISQTIGQWTGGQLSVASFERGTDTREGVFRLDHGEMGLSRDEILRTGSTWF